MVRHTNAYRGDRRRQAHPVDGADNCAQRAHRRGKMISGQQAVPGGGFGQDNCVARLFYKRAEARHPTPSPTLELVTLSPVTTWQKAWRLTRELLVWAR